MQMVQHLSEDDPDRRVQFCDWAVDKMDNDPQFSAGILFSDEANFYCNGEVNRQNMRYWSDANPQWLNPSKMVGAEKTMVWCGIWQNRIIGPFFIDGNMNAQIYLKMLQERLIPALMNDDGEFPERFQQDGAPPHYGLIVREWLDKQFPNLWIGRRGPVEWPPRSPDLTPLDFYLWGHLKAVVYAERIRDRGHLQDRIRAACMSVSAETLTLVRQEWEKRMHMCIACHGEHIEHIK